MINGKSIADIAEEKGIRMSDDEAKACGECNSTNPYCHKVIADSNPMSESIRVECDKLASFLIEKNESYGNSVCDPLRIFSKADPIEQINVRLDDKLNRLLNGKDYGYEDTELDLLGYLLLKRAVIRVKAGIGVAPNTGMLDKTDFAPGIK